ncbi:MAG: Do/DeqQ family serine protease [Gammaproteobacteria bacterium]|jgi:Do/DeqQ family serine protease
MGKILLVLILSTWLTLGFAGLPVAVGGQVLPSLAPMLDKATPAVVNIATRGKTKQRRQSSLYNDPFFQRFFNLPGVERTRETQSLGSGVIVDAQNGYILTNNHVIKNAYEITVTLTDGREMQADIIGSDPDTDIAVIQVKADKLTELPIADSSLLRVGDFVVAIGNPFGLGQTVTSGIVSALSRSGLGLESFEDFIQTDASINVGNSGGALVNLRGELIGINTAILNGGGASSGSIGIGFAIPINMAHQIMLQLVEFGQVQRGRLGAQGQDLTLELAQAFGVSLTSGFIVTQIEKGSPADSSGIEIGDIITSANNKIIRSSQDIINLVGLLRMGQSMDVTLYRQGEKKQLKVVIQPIEVAMLEGKHLLQKLAGAKIGQVSESSLKYGLVTYLQVIEIESNSPAWRAGMRENDVLYSINQQLIPTFEQALETIKNHQGDMILNIQRGNRALYLVIK